MPDTSTIQSLPYIMPSQAQKHITHNEAVRVLDVIVQLSVFSRALSTPPALPATGDRYIVGPSATDDWLGKEKKVAVFEGIAWAFFTPVKGWQCYILDEQQIAVFDNDVWSAPSEFPAQVSQLGVSAMADNTNRLTVSADATLLNNAGAGHQLKINKATDTDTASLMFQTGYSGRAEMGTTGSDDFAIKVSADGSTFKGAMSFDRATGRSKAENGFRLTPAAGDLSTPGNGDLWYNATSGKFRAYQNGSPVDLIGAGGGGGGSVFSDASFTLQDDLDVTKQARLQLSGLTTGTINTFSLPGGGAGGTLTSTAGPSSISGSWTFQNAINTFGSSPQTSTNALSSGATLTGQTKTVNIGTGGLSGSTTNVEIGSATSGALGRTLINSPTVAFANTVTAINLPDGATFITDNVDPAKKLQFEVSGITSGTTRTVSVPDASGTMVLTGATQTLTGKTINLQANTVTGTLAATAVSMAGGGTAQDYAGFGSRAGFVSWASGKTPALGTVIDAAGYAYRYVGSGTAISDLPGWVPVGYAFPDHWTQNVTPGVTNMQPALTAALGYSATVYMSGGAYAVGDTVAWDNATLLGNNDRGTARTRLVGLSASIPISKAIVAPGRSSTIRAIQIGYDALTGTETTDQRVGLDTRGLTSTLQRGSLIDEVVFDNVGTAVSDYGTGEFSVTFGTLEIVKHSYRAVDIRGTSRTGSVWLNLYINGGSIYLPEGGFCYSGQGAGGMVGQLNVEHGAYSGFPVRLEGSQGMVINSLHIEGVDCTTANKGYIGLDSASVTIHSLNVLNTRMTTDNTAVVRLARAGYQSLAVSAPLATASVTSNLKIGKLHMKGLASPNDTLYPTYPVGRTGVRNCPGFNVFKRDPAYTDDNWLVEVSDYLWGLFPLQAADRPFVEFPDVSYSGQIQIKRLGERGST